MLFLTEGGGVTYRVIGSPTLSIKVLNYKSKILSREFLYQLSHIKKTQLNAYKAPFSGHKGALFWILSMYGSHPNAIKTQRKARNPKAFDAMSCVFMA